MTLIKHLNTINLKT